VILDRFVSDHMEIFSILIRSARAERELGLHMCERGPWARIRVLRMIRELICERMDEGLRVRVRGIGPRPTFVRRLLCDAKAAAAI